VALGIFAAIFSGRMTGGFFLYQCRADDMIICGGNNIAGREEEAVLADTL